MKRIVLASVLGMAVAITVSSARAQGYINLDNYGTYGPYVTYGSGTSQMEGTTAGNGIADGATANGSAGNLTWTIGLYYALGNVTGSVGSDPTGFGTSSFNGLSLGSGTGATTQSLAALPGAFSSSSDFSVPGYASGVVTLEILAYSGSDYASSAYRGHSAAFTITPSGVSGSGTRVGTAMPGFSVYSAPEPSLLALSGIGAAALMVMRRRKK